jgi:hypothetical protein
MPFAPFMGAMVAAAAPPVSGPYLGSFLTPAATASFDFTVDLGPPDPSRVILVYQQLWSTAPGWSTGRAGGVTINGVALVAAGAAAINDAWAATAARPWSGVVPTGGLVQGTAVTGAPDTSPMMMLISVYRFTNLVQQTARQNVASATSGGDQTDPRSLTINGVANGYLVAAYTAGGPYTPRNPINGLSPVNLDYAYTDVSQAWIGSMPTPSAGPVTIQGSLAAPGNVHQILNAVSFA